MANPTILDLGEQKLFFVLFRVHVHFSGAIGDGSRILSPNTLGKVELKKMSIPIPSNLYLSRALVSMC